MQKTLSPIERLAAKECNRMIEESAANSSGNARPLLAIGLGGLVAGILDLLQACIQLGWDIPLYISAGLLGRWAVHGGVALWVLGVLLHFFIAFSWATVYYGASRRLGFLKEHWLICGLYYGITVYLVMDFIVLPLSGLHGTGPFSLHDLLVGIPQKMIVVGLPIAFSVSRFAK
jgi:hypothetical protein